MAPSGCLAVEKAAPPEFLRHSHTPTAQPVTVVPLAFLLLGADHARSSENRRYAKCDYLRELLESQSSEFGVMFVNSPPFGGELSEVGGSETLTTARGNYGYLAIVRTGRTA